jgi:DNA-binding PadR family transcriptional regulator
MAERGNVAKHLPLSESTYYMMLSLLEPLHGYAVMQKVEEMSGRMVRVGPGTLYGAFSSMEKAKLIEKTGEFDRRKTYVLSAFGREVLAWQILRLEKMLSAGKALFPGERVSPDA